MITTAISAYSVKQVLKQNSKGVQVVGYTVKPGYSNGLFITNKKPQGVLVGYSDK